MNEKIWLSSPHMGEMERKFVTEAFDTNWISPVGPHISAFEDELCRYTGAGHCAALSSGTAAIHLALIILGIKRGDEVICSSFTFSGSCNPIAYVGATPVFVDSEEATWNMDPALLSFSIEDRLRKTGKKPSAIILVHLYGMPADIDGILRVARAHSIPVIEDAAEALGSTYQGKALGTFGDIGVYSFNGNKIITTSGGGALISENKDWVAKARFLATQARDAAPHYQHTEIGYNYRLSNVCAGIGRGQLLVLDERVQQRRTNFKAYYEGLRDLKGILFLPEPDGAYANRWLTTILIDPAEAPTDRVKIAAALEQLNIECRPLWKPMHMQPVFIDAPAYSQGVSESLFAQGLCLPSGSNLSEASRALVIDAVRSCW